ncbi:hypothetical protein CYY_004189 [Polysphondylium violaceum]|uniref:Fucosyltransferase n=1 Tax=Polysphondylium violaceum TaxID=133409 RepID=A0A8J4UT73_9MYCE|nr:hypothetical protein CYY_004189 [Polysphondylium violaceum]
MLIFSFFCVYYNFLNNSSLQTHTQTPYHETEKPTPHPQEPTITQSPQKQKPTQTPHPQEPTITQSPQKQKPTQTPHLGHLRKVDLEVIVDEKLSTLPIVNNRINAKFMTRYWDQDILKDQIEVCNVGGEKYQLNMSMHHQDSDAHIQAYYDSDIVDRYVRWLDTPNVPKVLLNPESFAKSRCAKHHKCVSRFNWVVSTAIGDDAVWPYFSPLAIKSNFFNKPLSDFQKIVMNPKLEFRKEDKREYESNSSNTEPYQPALASWFASNCDFLYSNRKFYIQEMMNHMKIDSYGPCLNTRHLKDDDRTKLNEKIKTITKYKFYLSFENSYCRGYITEKPYQCLQNNVVPVLMVHPDNLKLMPRGSYIYVGHYKSPKELAEYLIKLENDDKEYQKYFAWRNDPAILQEWYDNSMAVFGDTSIKCKIVELYIKWIKEGAWTLPKSYPLKNACLHADFFDSVSTPSFLDENKIKE